MMNSSRNTNSSFLKYSKVGIFALLISASTSCSSLTDEDKQSIIEQRLAEQRKSPLNQNIYSQIESQNNIQLERERLKNEMSNSYGGQGSEYLVVDEQGQSFMANESNQLQRVVKPVRFPINVEQVDIDGKTTFIPKNFTGRNPYSFLPGQSFEPATSKELNTRLMRSEIGAYQDYVPQTSQQSSTAQRLDMVSDYPQQYGLGVKNEFNNTYKNYANATSYGKNLGNRNYANPSQNIDAPQAVMQEIQEYSSYINMNDDEFEEAFEKNIGVPNSNELSTDSYYNGGYQPSTSTQNSQSIYNMDFNGNVEINEESNLPEPSVDYSYKPISIAPLTTEQSTIDGNSAASRKRDDSNPLKPKTYLIPSKYQPPKITLENGEQVELDENSYLIKKYKKTYSTTDNGQTNGQNANFIQTMQPVTKEGNYVEPLAPPYYRGRSGF